jgi:hypothetical protein
MILHDGFGAKLFPHVVGGFGFGTDWGVIDSRLMRYSWGPQKTWLYYFARLGTSVRIAHL